MTFSDIALQLLVFNLNTSKNKLTVPVCLLCLPGSGVSFLGGGAAVFLALFLTRAGFLGMKACAWSG